MEDKKNTDDRRELIRKGILILAAVLIIVSGFQIVSAYMEKRNAQREYERLAELAKQTTEAPSTQAPTTETEAETIPPYVSPIDFAALEAINPDIVGWLEIPGTNVNYPIVHTNDNDKYLHTDFEGNESVAGSIYLDCDSQPDFLGRHNVIYGHNMKNGSMFKDVTKFKEEEYFKDHRDIYIYLPDREIHLRTVAALYGGSEGIKRKTQFKSDETFDAYVEEMTKDCEFRELPAEKPDRLYSLITCSYEFDDARTILYAVETEESTTPGEN